MKAKELIEKCILGQGNQVRASVLTEVFDQVIKPYASLERLRPYLYRISFDELPEDIGMNMPIAVGCSAFVQDGKLHRTLDFLYDEAASFIVRTRDFEGMSFITGLNDGALTNDLLSQLPYKVVDGVNNSGIRVSTHVLFNDWDWAGVGDKSLPLTKLPFYILTHAKSMATLAQDLGDILSNLDTAPVLEGSGYLLQILVTDGTTTYAVLPPTEANQAFVLQDISANPKLTNFRWVADETAVRTNLQRRPTGVERFNMMPCALADLRFTKAYESADRLSEFIGIGETTKDSTDEELTAIYGRAHDLYLERQRDGQTWQTMHAVVYGSKMEALYIQENFNDDICYNPAAEIGDLASLDTDHKSSIVEAINEIADAIETEELVVSMTQSNAERKVIYDLCIAKPQLTKNVVFLNGDDSMYYRVNGYKVANSILYLHTVMPGDDGLRSIVVQISSTGSISV